MERRQFLAAGSLGVAGGAFALADPTATSRTTAATPSTTQSTSDDYHFGFTGYDVATDVDVDVAPGAPVSFEVTASGDTVDDGETVTFEVSMTNESAEPVEYETGAPEPFGVLSLRDEEIATWLHPWTDAYAESNHVTTTEARGVGPVHSIALSMELEPGETVAERYTLSTATHRIRPGTYRGRISNGAAHGHDSEEAWRVTAEFTVDIEPAGDPETREFERSLSAAAINDPDFDGRIDVTVQEPMTDTHPGLIEVSFTSRWEQTRLLRVRRELPFGSYVSEPVDGARLVLQTDDMYAPGFARSDRCWRSAFVPDHFTRGFTTGIDPGERHRLRYLVLGHPDDDCPPAGDYEFTVHYETKGEESGTKEKQTADLGFTLSLGDAPTGYREAMTPRASESRSPPGSSPTSERTDEATSTVTKTPTGAGTPTDSGTAKHAAEPTAETAVDAQHGFGVGAAVAGLAGWLGVRRRRENR